MYGQIMDIIFIIYQKFNVKVTLNTILTLLISNLLVIYLYDIKVFQILHSTYHKLNEEVNDFIILLTKVFNLLSFVHVKNCFIFKFDFKWSIHFCLLIMSSLVSYLMFYYHMDVFHAISTWKIKCLHVF